MSGRDAFDDDPLDVVELLAEDDDRRAEPARDDERPRALSRRRIVVVAAVALAAVVAGSLTVADGPDDTDVGIASPSSTRGSPTTARSALDDLPDIPPGQFAAAVGGRVAFSRSGELLVFDPQRPGFERVRNVGGLGANVVGAAAHSLLVSDNDGSYVVDDGGTVIELGSTPVFPSSDGLGWWRVDADRLTPVGFLTDPVAVPAETRPVSALRDGFLLAPEGEREPGPLLRWVPGSDPVAIEGTSNGTIAAVHPDRIAWYAQCPEVSCALQVSDLVSGQTVAIPGLMPIFGQGSAAGRFSPDASRLALLVTGSGRNEFVVVDLTTGAVTTREQLDGRIRSSRVAPYLYGIPFDFTRDGNRIVLADSTSGTRGLVTLDPATGEREPSNDTLRSITSVVALDVIRTPPLAPLAAPEARRIGGVVALRDYGGDRLTMIDIGSTEVRAVELGGSARVSETDGFSGSTLVGVRQGFVTLTNGLAEFVRFDGTVTAIGDADWVVASSDGAQAWTFDLRDDGTYDARSLDGTTGEVRAERTVSAAPSFVVADEFVRLVAASFDRPAQIERWNVRTGASTFVDASGIGTLSAATERYAVGQGTSCYERGRDCALRVVELDTGEPVAVTTEGDPYVPQNSTAGDAIYVAESGRGLVRIDLSTGARELVPGSVGTVQWAVAANGTVVYGASDAVYAWLPGTAEPLFVAPGRLESENGLELAAAG